MAKAKQAESPIEGLTNEEIAEVVGKEEQNDLTASGRDKTEVHSETKVVDYTEVQKPAPVIPSEAVDIDLGNGTILRSYVAVTPSKPDAEDE